MITITANNLVRSILHINPPDVERSLDDPRGEGSIRLPCYSESRLAELFGSDVAALIARANDGEPMWEHSVRNYLLGALDQTGQARP